MTNLYIGIDVQANRHCPYAVLSEAGEMVESGWLSPNDLMSELGAVADKYPVAAFAVDAPRMPLPAPRQWYWRGGEWVKRGATDKGRGRHCEVVVNALKL